MKEVLLNFQRNLKEARNDFFSMQVFYHKIHHNLYFLFCLTVVLLKLYVFQIKCINNLNYFGNAHPSWLQCNDRPAYDETQKEQLLPLEKLGFQHRSISCIMRALGQHQLVLLSVTFFLITYIQYDQFYQMVFRMGIVLLSQKFCPSMLQIFYLIQGIFMEKLSQYI